MMEVEYDGEEFRSRPARLEKEREQRQREGAALKPVLPVTGRDLSRTFWGQAWNRHLMEYSDYESRMPRGRTTFRKGGVMDLETSGGVITAVVEEGRLWDVRINVKPVDEEIWLRLKEACVGRIGSVLELLSGEINREVMSLVADASGGLFPAPGELKGICSCPDHAGLCRHSAAVLYAMGCVLDENPGLLFQWRGVQPSDLVTQAPTLLAQSLSQPETGIGHLDNDDLGGLFGITLEEEK